jgi:hypothetical protein
MISLKMKEPRVNAAQQVRLSSPPTETNASGPASLVMLRRVKQQSRHENIGFSGPDWSLSVTDLMGMVEQPLFLSLKENTNLSFIFNDVVGD